MPLSLLPVLVSLLLLVWTAPASAGLLFATWTEPTQNTDGSALTNLHHYRLYYGPNAASVTPCQIAPAFQDVNAVQAAPPANSVTGADITGVTQGTTYFVSMTAVNSAGGESACSTVVSGLARANGTTVLVTLVTGSGTVSGEGSYPVGTIVTPIATPNAGYVLSSWTGGGCSGAGACHVTLSTNQFVRATFVPGTPPVPPSGLGFGPSDQLLLTASVAGPGTITGSGILCGIGNTPDCTQHYAPSTTVPLTATPDAGQLHLGWANACSGIGGCSVLMDSAKSVSATFGTITDPGQPQVGTPTVGPTSATYPVTWDPSIVQPLGTPVTLYQYNGGYNDGGSVTYSSTATTSLNLVLPNRSPAECLALQGTSSGCTAYICVQGQFGAGGALSPNQICQGFFVPAVAPSVLVETFPTNGPITSAQDLPWTNFGNLSVAGGDAVTTPPGGGGNAVDRGRANVDLATSDQYAEATVVFTPSSGLSAAGVLARFDSAGENGYAFFVDTFDGTNYFAGLRQTIAGGDFEIGTDVNVTSHMLATNVFSIVVSGTGPNIRVEGYVNGVLVDTATGQTLYDGNTRTGIMFYSHPGGSASDVRITHFAAQDLAQTTVAASCQQSDVAAAIVKTLDGGTVTIPAGQCTIANGTAWTQNLTINKRLNIVGAGDGSGSTRGCGSCATVIQDNRNQADLPYPGPPQIFVWNIPNTGLSTLSGILWQGVGIYRSNDSPTNGMIRLASDGLNTQFRLHHSTFIVRGGCSGVNCSGTSGLAVADLMGVIDHNVFDSLPGDSISVYTRMPHYGGLGWYGDNSWAQPSTMGTDQAMYFEDNDLLGVNSSALQASLDGWEGERRVIRHNFIRDNLVGGHGTDSSGRERSFRHHEIYENDWLLESNTNFDTVAGFRGGTGVLFNNRVVTQPGAIVNRFANISVFRAKAGTVKDYAVWGRCGQFPVSLHESGTTVTITATSDTFNSPTYITIINASQSGYNGTFAITVSDSLHAQYTAPVSGLADDAGTIMSAWDENSDVNGYACIDQSGHGQGDYLGGADDPAGGNPANAAWPHQALEPAYAWNNTVNGQVSPIIPSEGSVLVEDRDFYNCTIGSPKTGCLAGIVGSPPGSPTPKPGYTPYIYPHPLVAPPPTITALSWDFAGAQVRIPSTLPGGPTTGSDLWPFAQDSNLNVYTAYGDGGGMHGDNTVCRTVFGLHTVTGTPPNYTYANTWGCKADGTGCGDNSPPFQHNATCDATFSGSQALAGVPEGLTAVDTTLYAILSDNHSVPAQQVTLHQSTTQGQSWTAAGWSFPATTGNFLPHTFVQSTDAGAAAAYVYILGSKVGTAANLYLARALKASVMTQGAWEYFTGTSSVPTWGAWGSATAIYSSSAQPSGSMQYFPVLQRYIFIPRGNALPELTVLAGPNPWGPWTTVYSSSTWGNYEGLPALQVSVNIIPSSISSDNLTFWMSFSGCCGVNNWDNLSLIKGTFTVTP